MPSDRAVRPPLGRHRGCCSMASFTVSASASVSRSAVRPVTGLQTMAALARIATDRTWDSGWAKPSLGCILPGTGAGRCWLLVTPGPPPEPWLAEGSRSESEIHRPGLPTVRNERCLWSLNGWAPCGSVMWFSKTGIFTAKQLTSQSRPSALTTVGRVNEYTEM